MNRIKQNTFILGLSLITVFIGSIEGRNLNTRQWPYPIDGEPGAYGHGEDGGHGGDGQNGGNGGAGGDSDYGRGGNGGNGGDVD